jgi:hypothetical protein
LKTSLLLILALALVPAAVRAEGTMTAGASTPAGKNMLWNGAFDAETLRPWSVMYDSPRFGSAAVTAGELCFKLAEPSVHGVVQIRLALLGMRMQYQMWIMSGKPYVHPMSFRINSTPAWSH